MEKFWNHKRIRLLLGEDTDTAEQFLAQFGPVIYTWFYYQIGADAKVALDLTSRTFLHAIKNLSTFDPAEGTLFGWLKQQAAQSRDEGLKQWQIKPQRPWAWSQLSDEILCGLSRFRSNPLNEKILYNPFVHEIAQATLAELETVDRELLTQRYCHLDTAEHIAEEMDCSIEDVQNQLYRSRHSFRRILFQLIASVNSGFSESGDTGEIEIQDANLEKLLSTTAVSQELDDLQTDMLRAQLLQAIEESALTLDKETPQPGLLMALIALAVVIALLSGVYLATRSNRANNAPPPVIDINTPRQPPQKEPARPEAKEITQNDIEGEELRQVFALGQAGHIDALLEILKSGQFPSQTAAAHFLGRLADANAIDPLQQAENHWYPESIGDNPFADAIKQILIRFPEAAPVAVVEKIKPKPDTKKKTKHPPAKTPNITGHVRDFSNQPIANAVVELTENPLFSKIATGRKFGSIKTNPLGQYQFSNTVYNRAISLACQTPAEDTKVITRSLWYGKDSICLVNIGGQPALTGSVIIDGRPLAGQTLYLSDALEVAHASFSEKVITDEQGNFTFLGVLPGVYSIMNRGLDNRIHRLATIEMPQRNMFNVNLDFETVSVLLDYPIRPEDSSAFKAVLVYALDVSDNLGQIPAVLAEDGSILFENVIPGDYVLRTRLNDSVWLQQNVEITDELTEQTIHLDMIPKETSTLRGHFFNAAPIDLFLTTVNREIHIDIAPSADGYYELATVPSDIYSLAAFVKGRLIEFAQIDLQSESEATLDIDPAKMMSAFSPLHIVVTDASGIVLSNTQIWLTETGGENLITGSTTGQGVFLAAPASQYTLSVAHPKYSTVNRKIVLKPSTLLAEPNLENTTLIQLGVQDTQ